jgi:hypothetical protein
LVAPTPSQPDDPAYGRLTWCNSSSRATVGWDDERLEDYVKECTTPSQVNPYA